MLIDTCSILSSDDGSISFDSCKTDVFEPVCYDGQKTMQSPCHVQVVDQKSEFIKSDRIFGNVTYFKLDENGEMKPATKVTQGYCPS